MRIMFEKSAALAHLCVYFFLVWTYYFCVFVSLSCKKVLHLCVCISFLYERITLKITSVCMSISFSHKYFVSLSPYFLSYLPVCLLVKTSFVNLCCLLLLLFFICIYISVSFLPLSYCLPNFCLSCSFRVHATLTVMPG